MRPARSANQAAIDPRFPACSCPAASSARSCRASGSITNGQWTGGLNNHPINPDSGKKDGWYYDLPMFSYAPRVGLAWDVFGDGKTAVRASTGVFYNFVNQGQYRPV